MRSNKRLNLINRRRIIVLWRGFFHSLTNFKPGPTSPIPYEIFRRMVGKGFNIKIICWRYDTQLYYENLEGMEIIRIKQPHFKYFVEQILGIKMTIKTIIEILKKKCDLLYIMGEPTWHGWSLFIAKLFKIPTLLGRFDAWYPLYKYEKKEEGAKAVIGLSNLLFNNKAIIVFLEKISAKCADYVVTVTEELKKYLVKLNIPEKKISVIPNAASISYINERKILNLKIKHDINSNDILIGYLGGIRKIHKVDILFRAFINLVAKYENIKLIYIGDGNYLEFLKLEVATYLSKRVIFTGPVLQSEVPTYLSLIDCGCIIWENNLAMNCASPLKLFEYMACGKPVVGGATKHIKQVIKNAKCGIIIEIPDVENTAKALEKFIELPKEKKIEMGKNAYNYIKYYWNWDVVGEKYEEICKNLICKK